MALYEGDNVRIDVNRLVSSIEDMMPHDLHMPPKCCIFKTPVILSMHNEKDYIPDAFSIGPLHHSNPNLKATEKIKLNYFQGLISRSPFPETMLRTLINSIMEVEKEARECYAEAIHYNPEELVKILVIDGCFLIELFRKKAYKELREEDDTIFTTSCMTPFLAHDLILLENQVPWMVLEILFNLTILDSNSDDPLILLATGFLNDSFLSYVTCHPVQSIMNIKGIKHLVDLLRKLSTLSTEENEEKEERISRWQSLPYATSLVEAGIIFKRGASRSILDVKFIDGVLEIPPLPIHETTETIFRNLISYEQCLPKCEARITSYVVLLDSLIDTANDMNILCKNHIIDNRLNPQDSAQFFNKLYNDTYVNHYYFNSLSQQVNDFCRCRFPRWRAVLVRNYFNTPWSVLSALATIILLIMTFLQTLYCIKK